MTGHCLRVIDSGQRKGNAGAMHPVLVIEDTPSMRFIYERILARAGYMPLGAGSLARGREMFRERRPELVLLDLMLPDGDGMTLLGEMLAEAPCTRVIVITANASIHRAVEAMRAGASDFLVKPFDEERLLTALANAERALEPAPEADPDTPFDEFIGSSPAMQAVVSKIRRAAPSMATLFITGESGTGKKMAARALHRASPRAAGPFVVLNCAALGEDVTTGQGHRRDARLDTIARAHGGTLLLDEICEADHALQARLLQFLQEGTLHDEGGNPRKIDVRLVCSSSRNPYEEVRKGRFLENLFYRLHVIPLRMPALRERGDDVIEIAEVKLRELAREEGKSFSALDDEVKAFFRSLPWPGNVRQLFNVLRNVVVLHDGGRVTRSMLPVEILHLEEDDVRDEIAQTVSMGETPLLVDDLIGRPLDEIERLVIEATIAREGGSIPRAARVLGVSPSTIYRKREAWTGKTVRQGAPGKGSSRGLA